MNKTNLDSDLDEIFKRMFMDRWLSNLVLKLVGRRPLVQQLTAEDSTEKIESVLNEGLLNAIEDYNHIVRQTNLPQIHEDLLKRDFSRLYVELDKPLSFACPLPKRPDIPNTGGIQDRYEILEGGKKIGYLALNVGDSGIYAALEIYPKSDGNVELVRRTFPGKIPSKRLEELARRRDVYTAWIGDLQKEGYILTLERRYTPSHLPVGYTAIHYTDGPPQLKKHPMDYTYEDVLRDRPEVVEISDFTGKEAELVDGEKYSVSRDGAGVILVDYKRRPLDFLRRIFTKPTEIEYSEYFH